MNFTVIQGILALFGIFGLLGAVFRFRKGLLNGVQLLFWSFIWIAVLIVVFRPETSSQVARLFGVGRGADLVVYIAVAALFFLQFRMLSKMEVLERQITKIVRTDALKSLEKDPYESK